MFLLETFYAVMGCTQGMDLSNPHAVCVEGGSGCCETPGCSCKSRVEMTSSHYAYVHTRAPLEARKSNI